MFPSETNLFSLHYAYFHLCANENTGLFQGAAWKVSESFGHLSEILQAIWCLLWRVAVKDCRVCVCVYREREREYSCSIYLCETARLSGLVWSVLLHVKRPHKHSQCASTRHQAWKQFCHLEKNHLSAEYCLFPIVTSNTQDFLSVEKFFHLPLFYFVYWVTSHIVHFHGLTVPGSQFAPGVLETFF